MRNLPVNLSGYRFMITESIAVKMVTDDKTGQTKPALNFDGTTQFSVALFAKQRTAPGERPAKGEEIRVTLTADPGEFEEGQYVELINPVVSSWSRDGKGGMSMKAEGLKPAAPVRAAA
ncbi:hypothetical protein [Crossiella sp. CA198]|uniref:hypothetical protein n=1 Tax=Crossiella sp. CA198 TaxID=3455607 RepID=UPI003F8CF5E7